MPTIFPGFADGGKSVIPLAGEETVLEAPSQGLLGPGTGQEVACL